jgi:hypothetical protein
MQPSDDTSETIRGKRYSVKTATLLASDEYWDGHNYTRSGRNNFLYKTPNGAYFQVTLTQWQGERDELTPLSKQEAMALWECLPEREVSYSAAFNVAVKNA